MKIKIFYLENMGDSKGIGIGVMQRGKYTLGLHVMTEVFSRGVIRYLLGYM